MKQKSNPEGRATDRARRRRSRGQSLAEFALILPIFLTIFGATLDFARLYQAWITLQNATRVGAEYAAGRSTTAATAFVDARREICRQVQTMPGFQRSLLPAPNDVDQCSQPTVTLMAFSRSTTDPGGSAEFPIGSATVRSTLPFRTFFSYPLLTDNGTWTIQVSESYRIAQGR